ncbi:MAG: hypothetical protein AB7G93_08235 [Bdellovibrionales bacterium]
MNTQVNWQKIRTEFQRLTDIDQLKQEVQRIGTEIRNFDYQSVLSPGAKTKVKMFEKRYSDLMRTIYQAQRQMDREFNRILRQLKGQKKDMSRTVAEQKEKLERVTADFKKRFTNSADKAQAKARTTSGRTRTVRTKTASPGRTTSKKTTVARARRKA